MKEKKKTAGELIAENLKRVPDIASAQDVGKELYKNFEKWMYEWIEKGRTTYEGDFFIIVNLKLEQSLEHAPHIIPELRQTCPDPFYDQSVWHYKKELDELEFLWSIPDLGTTLLFKDDPLNCPSDQKDLRECILDFLDGTLQQKTVQLNVGK